MELKIKHNLPYIAILMLFGILAKIYTDSPITIVNTITSLICYSACLLMFQNFTKPLDEFTVRGFLKKQAPLILLLSIGGIFSHYFIFHNFAWTVFMIYPLMTTTILITMEHSSYN